jgi:hypothetical protein
MPSVTCDVEKSIYKVVEEQAATIGSGLTPSGDIGRIFARLHAIKGQTGWIG